MKELRSKYGLFRHSNNYQEGVQEGVVSLWLEMEMRCSNRILVKACISSNCQGVDITPGVIELSAHGSLVRENSTPQYSSWLWSTTPNQTDFITLKPGQTTTDHHHRMFHIISSASIDEMLVFLNLSKGGSYFTG